MKYQRLLSEISQLVFTAFLAGTLVLLPSRALARSPRNIDDQGATVLSHTTAYQATLFNKALTVKYLRRTSRGFIQKMEGRQ